MTKRQRLLLFSSLGLLLAAFILFSLNRWITPSSLNIQFKEEPTIEWQSFPTRSFQGTTTPQSNQYSSSIQLAILRQEYTQAQVLIEEAGSVFPMDVRIRQHKARLAFAQNDFTNAENYVWEAIGLDPSNAITWAFAGTIFIHNDKPEMAEQAFSISSQLNPDLSSHLFQERWQLAVMSNDNEKLTALADEHYLLNADDPLAEYYIAAALRSSGDTNIAINLLVDRLARETHSPAILWFTLGQNYLDRGSYKESATALEYAHDLNKAGDASMLMAGDEPENIIENHLAKAYLGFQRCASAEAIFRRLAVETNPDDYAEWIAKAVTCQTPTPTPTHWMISLQD